MTEFIKRRIKNIKSDRIQAGTMAISGTLAACHAALYIAEPATDILISLIFCAAYIPLTFIAGRKTMAPFLYIFSLAIMLTSGTYKNYSAAWFATLALVNMPKKSRPVLIALHIAATISVCYMHNKTSIHLAVYICNAFFLYLATNLFIKEKARPAPLDITDDERKILQELRSGKQQKEIEIFSVNTITKKLRDARTRNNAGTTEELLVRFIAAEIEL